MKTIQIEEVQKSEVPAAPGIAFAGGFFVGQVNVNGDIYALIVAPKDQGEFDSTWGEYGEKINGANWVADGLRNTEVMAAAGLAIATQAQDLKINEKSDWYIPARDELEIIYRNLKPSTRENWCSWRDGDNPSAVPPSSEYTEDNPGRTAVQAFQEDGSEAMDPVWYWTSTQVSAYYAAVQFFSYGVQDNDGKDDELRVRVVRRLRIV